MRFKNKPAPLRRAHRRYEFLLVTAVIGVVALVGIDRYLELGRDTRRMGFELLAHHFTTAVAGVRVQWLIQKAQTGERRFIELDGSRIFFSPAGWPAGIDQDFVSVKDDLVAADCLKLWQVLLQNPSPASLEGTQVRGSRRYHIRLPAPGICRYELVTRVTGSLYFDYSPVSGQIIITVPTENKIPAL